MPELNELAIDDKKNTRARFEQWVKNPQCEANALSAVLNVKMREVAESLGYRAEYGQSPFAITRGLQFEAWLYKDNAKVFRESLIKSKLLAEGDSGFEDLRLTINGGKKIKKVDQAIDVSTKILQNLSNDNDFKAPSIIAGLALRIPKGVMLPEATLIIDATLITKEGDDYLITVGEIKVFPDRGGHTDPSEIATARAQAGVYQHALSLSVQSMNLAKPPIVNEKGFLVFTWPGSNSPVIRANEDLRYQALRAEQGFDQLDGIAVNLMKNAPKDPSEYFDWVAHSRTDYREACWNFCDLAARCQDMAIADDRAIVLGREAARTLGTVTVTRAIELMEGAEPKSDFEKSLGTQLKNFNWEALNK